MALPRKSHLYDYHKDHAKLTEFSGFEMPIWYSSIVDEHMAVRNSAGLFDVSHMGRVSIEGKGANDFISYILTTNPSRVRNGRAFYSVICNEKGGIIDDVITNKFSESRYSMVINAGNREKDLAWLERISRNYDVSLVDYSDTSALIAFQGPLAPEIMQKLVNENLSELNRFSFFECKVNGERCLLSRTGYTGEDGYEITIFDTPLDRPQRALSIWTKLLDLGRSFGVLPCGLGARDSLRLEAGMCLYGQDIDEKTTPIEASLESTVTLDEREFVGKAVIEGQMKNGTEKRRVTFSMIDQGIPRHGFEILFSGRNVGLVTSGTFSPLLKRGIGMGYVPSPLSFHGQKLAIQIRDSSKISEIVPVPFYDTAKFGHKRVT